MIKCFYLLLFFAKIFAIEIIIILLLLNMPGFWLYFMTYHFVAFFVSVLTNWETSNRYQIKNSVGQQVYFANEGKYGIPKWRWVCIKIQAHSFHSLDSLNPRLFKAGGGGYHSLKVLLLFRTR